MTRWFRLGVAVGALLWLALASAAEPPTLAVTLRVLDYDAKLNALLLAGDFQNSLHSPVRAWRAELRLRDKATAETNVFFVEHRAKRPVQPDDWGAWSVWIAYKPEVPEHRALKAATAERLEPELWLIRVLYADGNQEGF